jgi:simple sugar transport system ATP-binding protein
MANRPLAIRMSDIDKAFGPVLANRGAALEVAAGEIHALVGENGAGKSTLMRLLSGMYAPDSGTVEVNGRDVTGWTTATAIAAGVGMVHQHFMLVPTLTVAENVVLGREPTSGMAGMLGTLDRARAERDVSALGAETGLTVAADRTVADLSVGEAQRVEILKTLFRGARILILDEPTAVLSPPEVAELWRVLRRIRDGGGTIVLITHKLDEVIDVSDNITVMRAGRTVARLATAETTPAAIARAMVGRDVVLSGLEGEALGATGLTAGLAAAATLDGRSGAAHGGGAPEPAVRAGTGSDAALGAPPTGIAAPPMPRTGTDSPRGAPSGRATWESSPSLDVRDLVVGDARRARVVDRVGFTVAPGEILGIAGVEGNGQTELVEAIAGLRRAAAGSIRLAGRDGALRDVTALDVRSRADAGLSHIPEDRHRRGLVLDYSIADNLILGRQHLYAPAGRLDFQRIAAHAVEQIHAFDIRPPDSALPARALSGGNQQKIVIAREMGRDFQVLLAAQPTRGVDVGAIEFIHRRLREARAAGRAILLVSAELNEILALADRVAVMYGGRIVAVLPRAAATSEVLGPYMTGARAEEAA